MKYMDTKSLVKLSRSNKTTHNLASISLQESRHHQRAMLGLEMKFQAEKNKIPFEPLSMLVAEHVIQTIIPNHVSVNAVVAIAAAGSFTNISFTFPTTDHMFKDGDLCRILMKMVIKRAYGSMGVMELKKKVDWFDSSTHTILATTRAAAHPLATEWTTRALKLLD